DELDERAWVAAASAARAAALRAAGMALEAGGRPLPVGRHRLARLGRLHGGGVDRRRAGARHDEQPADRLGVLESARLPGLRPRELLVRRAQVDRVIARRRLDEHL